MVKVGDHWSKSLVDLAVEAGREAIKQSNYMSPGCAVIGNMFSSLSSRQENLGALVVNGLGLTGISAFKVEAAGASGGAAIEIARSMIRCGSVDSVLVVGVEKMRDLAAAQISSAMSMAVSADYTQFFGASLLALNAMLARLYMHEYGVSRDELSSLPALAHRNAVTAEHAQFRRKIGVENVSRSMLISDPLRILDCAPVGDGAAALFLVSENALSRVRSPLVELASSSVATGRFSFYERKDMLDFTATRLAAEKALSAASLSIKDVHIAEVNDAYSAMAALCVEALGLSKRGEGAKDAAKGKFNLKGEFPISTFGGLKARGHPVGATGVYQMAEMYLQLAERAGENQVNGAQVALTHSLGGIDSTAVVHILRRTK